MAMPCYLWLVFTEIVGQVQDDLAISDTEDETEMDSLRSQHNSDDLWPEVFQNQDAQTGSPSKHDWSMKGRGLPTSQPNKTQGLSPCWSLQLS